MADSTAVIEMIKRIIADDTADLRERIQHLEQRNVMSQPVSIDVDDEPIAHGKDLVYQEHANDLQDRLQKIKAVHRLDASPVQYVRDQSTGKMVDAPDDLWEIQCAACNDKPTYWRKGDPEPPHCETWRLADGQ